MIRFLVPAFLGVCACAYLWHDAEMRDRFFCLLDKGLQSDRSLMAMPVFLATVLPTGVLGLVAAGMLAGFMSTHDSYLLC